MGNFCCQHEQLQVEPYIKTKLIEFHYPNEFQAFQNHKRDSIDGKRYMRSTICDSLELYKKIV
ncbi:hypothetical protein pb186bvf_019796 [Paramecium bursaria]